MTTKPRSITVEVKQVYGVDRIYPVCKTAKLFTRLTSTKTLTYSQLDTIRELGYAVALHNYVPGQFSKMQTTTQQG